MNERIACRTWIIRWIVLQETSWKRIHLNNFLKKSKRIYLPSIQYISTLESYVVHNLSVNFLQTMLLYSLFPILNRISIPFILVSSFSQLFVMSWRFYQYFIIIIFFSPLYSLSLMLLLVFLALFSMASALIS
jgi:hypothetical protein